jgi:hypothetical protein
MFYDREVKCARFDLRKFNENFAKYRDFFSGIKSMPGTSPGQTSNFRDNPGHPGRYGMYGKVVNIFI